MNRDKAKQEYLSAAVSGDKLRNLNKNLWLMLEKESVCTDKRGNIVRIKGKHANPVSGTLGLIDILQIEGMNEKELGATLRGMLTGFRKFCLENGARNEDVEALESVNPSPAAVARLQRFRTAFVQKLIDCEGRLAEMAEEPEIKAVPERKAAQEIKTAAKEMKETMPEEAAAPETEKKTPENQKEILPAAVSRDRESSSKMKKFSARDLVGRMTGMLAK